MLCIGLSFFPRPTSSFYLSLSLVTFASINESYVWTKKNTEAYKIQLSEKYKLKIRNSRFEINGSTWVDEWVERLLKCWIKSSINAKNYVRPEESLI